MINNDVIRSVRYMLNISEFKLVEIVKLGGGEVTQAAMNAYIKKAGHHLVLNYLQTM